MNHNAPRRIVIWIDHREALLAVFVADQLQQEEELFSDAGPHTHGGGWSQHRIDAHRHEQLKHFYDEIIDHLGMVDEIMILGPGQAKHELKTRIEHHKGLRGKVVSLESSDKLSEEQFIMRAEEYFALKS